MGSRSEFRLRASPAFLDSGRFAMKIAKTVV